jgi:hypothetical protein
VKLMNTLSASLRCERRVAFSKHAQPVWFRVAKWIIFAGVAIALFHTRLFWYWLVGLPMLGLCVHFLYRSKTHCWRRPWGGWDDLDAGRE